VAIAKLLAVACCMLSATASFASARQGQGTGARGASGGGVPAASRARVAPPPVPGARRSASRPAVRRVIPPRSAGRRPGLIPFWPPDLYPAELPPSPDGEAAPLAAEPLQTPIAPSEPSLIEPLDHSLQPFRSASSRTGTLFLDVEPATAQLFVDGFSAGSVQAVNAAGGLKTTAGWHRLEFRAQGYETAAGNVIVEPDRATTFWLKRNR
jgi:hypothetical protein